MAEVFTIYLYAWCGDCSWHVQGSHKGSQLHADRMKHRVFISQKRVIAGRPTSRDISDR